MNRTEAISAIVEMTNIAKKDVAAIIDAQDKLISKTLAEGQTYTLGISGKIELKQRAARTGRNPQTGEDIDIPAKNTAKFKPSKDLLNALV